MRLDFRNIGKGLVAVADAKKAKDLADEAAKYRITEGEYGTGLQSNIAQVQDMRQQAIAGGLSPEEAAAQYDPAIQELTRRSQMTAPDFSVASRGIDYGTAAEARTAAAPRRTEGLAGVYERYGDIEMADALRTRAAEQEYLAQTRPLQLKGLKQTETLNEMRIGQAKAEQTARENTEAARKQIADLRKNDKLTTQSIMAVAGQFGLDPKEFLTTEDAYKTMEYKDLKRGFSKAAAGGVQGMNEFLASRFDPDKTDNIVPTVVQDANGVRVMYGGRELTEYGRHKSFQDLVIGVQGLIDDDPVGVMKTLAQIEASRAQVRESNAKAGYYATGGRGTKRTAAQEIADAETALGRKLTDAEKSTLIGLQSRAGAERPVSQADITSRARMYLDNDSSGTLTPAEAIAKAEQDFGIRSAGPTNARAALIDAAINAPPRPAETARTTATPAGQQLLGLYNTVVPPAPAAPRAEPTTSEERLRRLYLGQ